MKKAKKVLKTTDTNSDYTKALIELYCGCPICGMNSGCNKRDKFTHDFHSWKSNRRQQWKKLNI